MFANRDFLCEKFTDQKRARVLGEIKMNLTLQAISSIGMFGGLFFSFSGSILIAADEKAERFDSRANQWPFLACINIKFDRRAMQSKTIRLATVEKALSPDIDNLDELQKLNVTSDTGAPVHISDIATIDVILVRRGSVLAEQLHQGGKRTMPARIVIEGKEAELVKGLEPISVISRKLLTNFRPIRNTH